MTAQDDNDTLKWSDARVCLIRERAKYASMGEDKPFKHKTVLECKAARDIMMVDLGRGNIESVT